MFLNIFENDVETSAEIFKDILHIITAAFSTCASVIKGTARLFSPLMRFYLKNPSFTELAELDSKSWA